MLNVATKQYFMVFRLASLPRLIKMLNIKKAESVVTYMVLQTDVRIVVKRILYFVILF